MDYQGCDVRFVPKADIGRNPWGAVIANVQKQ
jgi:hypothetical protein